MDGGLEYDASSSEVVNSKDITTFFGTQKSLLAFQIYVVFLQKSALYTASLTAVANLNALLILKRKQIFFSKVV